MDPKQPVVLQLLESLKDSYMSNDFKTCQQLLGQLKDIVDQKASLDGTDNEQQQLGELSNPPLDMKSVDPSLWDAEDEQDQELDDYNKMPYDAEWIAKTNCVEYPATIDDKEDNKEDEEYEVDEEEDDAKEDEEDDNAKEDDDSDAEEDEVDEKEDDDSGSEEDEEIQQPLRRSSRIKNVK